MPAGFSGDRLSLVDRGFVYAIAHVRGGTEKGWRWYRNGKLAKKPNTFTRLHRGRRASSSRQAGSARDRIVAHGGSAGGMLMGAIANMRPDLFAGIDRRSAVRRRAQHHARRHAAADAAGMAGMGQPDHRRAGLPHDRCSYSPYDNVRAQDYPAMLVLAGLTDPRVTYWEPAKWVARLRALDTGGRRIVLKTNMDAGHGGASGRFDRLKEVALAYAFAIKVARLPTPE